MLRQKISQKQLQKLSPQQIQLMKLLQVPTAVLEQRIEEELEANPALEEGKNDLEENRDEDRDEEKEEESSDDELDLADYLADDDYDNYKTQANNYSKDEEDKSIPIAVSSTFHERLLQQLGMMSLSEEDTIIAEHLVGSIDDDGYLRRELEAIIDDLAFTQNVTTTVSELERLLAKIQKFDPAGVGARDLRECLLLQLDRKMNKEEDEELAVARLILDKYFDAFTKKHYTKLTKQLNLNEEELKAAIDEILKLNPKPGGSVQGRDPNHYIIPDFIIKNNNGELEVNLNARNAPDLRVSNSFHEMLTAYNKSKKKDKKQKEAILFIKQKIDSAKWFIDAIKQRQHTLLSTMESIVEYQKEYFLTGDETKLRPMILKDIAEITELDISTISRVANSKYAQTEFGTLRLKSFFSESIQTESGEEVSTREVKKILSDIIDAENKTKPHSDQKLTEMLKEKGYNIARRTVAKYREQLSIPVARLRKEL